MKPNQDKLVNIQVLKEFEVILYKELLDDIKRWDSLDVDYYPPRVERLYTIYNGYRIHLHITHKTDQDCLYHKHRWPAVFKIIYGSYEMGVTYNKDEISSDQAHKQPDLMKIILGADSYYEMTQTDTLHYVKPISHVSYSIMLTHDLYPEAEFRKEILDQPLNKLTKSRKKKILTEFKSLLRNF